jgi:UDP-glucose 4-epimerase
MKVLVTGGSGFLGSAVREHPSAAGWDVQVLHRSTGSPPAAGGREHHIAALTDTEALARAIVGVDAVVHLAGPPSVSESFADPAAFLQAHVLGTSAVVEACLAVGAARLVYVSSAEVYGRPVRQPVAEDAALMPRSPYAAAKAGAEGVIGAAARGNGLDAIVLRPFSVYGPGQRRGGVLGLIMGQLAEMEPDTGATTIRLRDVEPVRDYVFVTDVADAVWRAVALEPAPGPRVFNVCSGRGTSVRDLAARSLVAAGRTGTVEQVAATGDRPAAADIRELVGDPAAARRDLGWTAATDLAAGLRQTIAWLGVG